MIRLVLPTAFTFLVSSLLSSLGSLINWLAPNGVHEVAFGLSSQRQLHLVLLVHMGVFSLSIQSYSTVIQGEHGVVLLVNWLGDDTYRT